MATTTKNEKKQLRGPSLILLAMFGTFPSEQVGYTDDKVEIEVEASQEEDEAQECLEPISSVTTKRRLMIAVPVAQVEPDNLHRVLGITPDGGNFALSGEVEEIELAALVVNTRDDSCPVYAFHPRMKSDGKLKLAIGRGKAVRVPINLKSLRAAGSYFRFGSTAEDETLTTGVAARTQTYPLRYISWLKITSESGASDDLTDITAGAGSTALTDGEIVRIQPKLSGTTITVKHGAGVIELAGEADFAMTKLADWLDLRYDLANTKWVEVARHDTE